MADGAGVRRAANDRHADPETAGTFGRLLQRQLHGDGPGAAIPLDHEQRACTVLDHGRGAGVDIALGDVAQIHREPPDAVGRNAPQIGPDDHFGHSCRVGGRQAPCLEQACHELAEVGGRKALGFGLQGSIPSI